MRFLFLGSTSFRCLYAKGSSSVHPISIINSMLICQPLYAFVEATLWRQCLSSCWWMNEGHVDINSTSIDIFDHHGMDEICASKRCEKTIDDRSVCEVHNIFSSEKERWCVCWIQLKRDSTVVHTRPRKTWIDSRWWWWWGRWLCWYCGRAKQSG